MDIKPLSFRLLNEQGVVHFFLLEIEQDKMAFSVTVQEKDMKFVGHVQLLKGATIEDFQQRLLNYEQYKKEKAEWDAMSESMKATKGPIDSVEPVTVQVNRVTHEEFPFMK